MNRIAEGDLDHRIRTRDSDELGRLAQQFNAMTAQVKAMLDQRRQLLLDVSHELRTPLTRLKLGLEALPESGERASLAEDVEALEGLVSELLEGAPWPTVAASCTWRPWTWPCWCKRARKNSPEKPPA